MKSILRALLSFLERKFPDKVEVTVERYTQLGVTIASLSEQAIKHEERIKALETQMTNTSLALGFTAPKFGTLER